MIWGLRKSWGLSGMVHTPLLHKIFIFTCNTAPQMCVFYVEKNYSISCSCSAYYQYTIYPPLYTGFFALFTKHPYFKHVFDKTFYQSTFIVYNILYTITRTVYNYTKSTDCIQCTIVCFLSCSTVIVYCIQLLCLRSWPKNFIMRDNKSQEVFEEIHKIYTKSHLCVSCVAFMLFRCFLCLCSFYVFYLCSFCEIGSTG